MILPKQEVMEGTGQSDSFNLDFTHRGVEQGIKNYCGWNIESATYTNIVVGGSGGDWLYPGHKNITALNRAAIYRQPVINVKHATASSNAFVRVTYTDLTPTSLSLLVDGSATTTKTFADYTSMATLLAQITGSGWSAEIYDTDYNAFPSTNLLELDNQYCGTWDGNDPGWTELYMPGRPVSDVRVERTGGLFRAAGWPDGDMNIVLSYVAGWTTATMPTDLKRAVLILTNYFYQQSIAQDSTGIKSFDLGHLKIEYEPASEQEQRSSSFPIEVLDILDMSYKILVI